MATTHRPESFPEGRRHEKLAHVRRRRQSQELLFVGVRNLVLTRRQNAARRWVTVEEISGALKARPGDVQRVFYQLVREGILSRAVSNGIPDSTRDELSPKQGASSWQEPRWLFRPSRGIRE
jgi:hypothetical protein